MNRIQSAVFCCLLVLLSGISCNSLPEFSSKEQRGQSLMAQLGTLPQIEGKTAYLNSPYVTAGNRLYMLGHQNGRFPALGWHVPGEMGGIWNHPIKLMDGFSVSLRDVESKKEACLDSASRFVNYPMANKHLYEVPTLRLEVERFQFVPDNMQGLIIEYLIRNKTANRRQLTFSFTGHADLMPVWLAAEKGISDGPDTAFFDRKKELVRVVDTKNPWTVVFGSAEEPAAYRQQNVSCQQTDASGNGRSATLEYTLIIDPAETVVLPFYIAGSYQSEEEALETYAALKNQSFELLEQKIMRYNKLIETARITIPDKQLETAYNWLKFNTDWLVREVPEVGRGLSAGLPDYPWWFGCDNTYALQGVLASGRPELVRETLEILHHLSVQQSDSGRIIHEASTNGVVFNPGNVNETPHFISMLWRYYQWTGERELLEKMYPTVKKGLQWLLEKRDKDANLYPDGFGMMEIHGLDTEMIDVAAYTQEALEAAAQMAVEMKEPEMGALYAEKAALLKKKINQEWWVPEDGSFADFRASKGKALELLDGALLRADTLGRKWAVRELIKKRKQLLQNPAGSEEVSSHVLYHNWVVNAPLETGLADSAKALEALQTARRYTNGYGVFVSGIDGELDQPQEEEQASFGEKKKKESFNYVGAVMTLPTGVMAVAEAKYGRTEESLDYAKRLASSFSHALPGSIYEVSPDYGMIVQAWNVYGIAVPLVQHIFGVKPKAHLQEISLRPHLPVSWQQARIEQLPLGNNSLSMNIEKKEGQYIYSLQQTAADWKIRLAMPYAAGAMVKVNGKAVEAKREGDRLVVELHGGQHTVLLQIPAEEVK